MMVRFQSWARPRIFLYAILAVLLLWYFSSAVQQHRAFEQPFGGLVDPARESRHSLDANISINLVVATTAKDDISWTNNLQIPNLNIVRYVSDDASAQYHPPAPKGREALMYFTYLHDFYDDLPHVSIFIHAEEHPWHADGALRGSMTFALEHLDLGKVGDVGYFNLRTSWKDACPTWINTSKTFDDWDKREEPYMIYAWQDNFGEEEVMPEMLGGPCCSQFAVTRETIRSRPQEQYKKSMVWLMDNTFGDYIAGRVWEHMWPWLFKREAIDCTDEVQVLCKMYSVCFNTSEELADYYKLWDERAVLQEKQGFWTTAAYPGAARELRERIERIEDALQRSLHDAVRRGRQSTTITSFEYGS